MFNYCWVRMVGAYEHYTFIQKSSGVLENNVLTTVKKHFCVNLIIVNTVTSDVLFRIYRTDDMMLKAATTMASARSERSFPEQQFLIRPKENSLGHRRVLAKENIIRAFVGTTPVMNQRKDAECMMDFLDATIVNGVQDPGITPIWEFLPRSAPLIDFLAVGLHSGAGWKYPSLNTVLGIQRNRGLSFQC